MKPIQVWRFFEAPDEFKKLSPHGGDEDWLALVPKEYGDAWIHWLDSGSPFGISETSKHPLESGDVVYIGAHA